MRKLRQIIMLIWIMAFVSACGSLPDDYKNESQTSDDGMLPTLSEVRIYSIPSDFYCVDFVGIENTVFLVGSGSGGHAFCCVDMESDTMKEISLPAAGSVFDLSVSEGNLCLATVCYAQPDNSGNPKEHFSLFELDMDANIKNRVELTGINDINLLAIGTPVVNGCAKIDSFILIIVNIGKEIVGERLRISGIGKIQLLHAIAFPSQISLVLTVQTPLGVNNNVASSRLQNIRRYNAPCLSRAGCAYNKHVVVHLCFITVQIKILVFPEDHLVVRY